MGTPPETDRKVPLHHIFKDSSFGLGAMSVLGWHFLNSPSGARFLCGPEAVSVPLLTRLGGGYAAYRGLSSAFEDAILLARQKEDPWNRFISRALAVGVLVPMYPGLSPLTRFAVVGVSTIFLFQQKINNDMAKEIAKLKEMLSRASCD